MNETSVGLEKVYDTISEVNREAYKDLFMLSNSVLCKTPYNNTLAKRCLRGESPSVYPFNVKIYKLFLYYIKSILHFGVYLTRFVEFKMSGLRWDLPKDGGEIALIDIPFLTEDIVKSSTFRNRYLPGLEDVLIKKGKKYAYLPFFHSSSHNRRPFELSSVFKILKGDKIALISEYQLLGLKDLLRTLFFIITYPFHVMKCSRKIDGDTIERRALRYELMDTIDHVTFYNYSRFLFGKRIARMSYGNMKIISWYENQPMNKNFYKGLRDGELKKSIKIYGAQLFLYSKKFLSIVPDENERGAEVLPDRILVNGAYYLPEKTDADYIVGPSLRYAGLFSADIKKGDRNNILVLLPYFIDDVGNILSILHDAKISSRNILIKAHPATPITKFAHMIPASVKVVDDDTVKLLRTTKILIGAASGTMIEAASIGIPVISIKRGEEAEFNNPLPEYGKGIIWDYAIDAKSLGDQVLRFEETLKARPEEISRVADKYKEMFFCNPTEENIIRAFEL